MKLTQNCVCFRNPQICLLVLHSVTRKYADCTGVFPKLFELLHILQCISAYFQLALTWVSGETQYLAPFSANFRSDFVVSSCKPFKCMLKTLFRGLQQHKILHWNQTVDLAASTSETLVDSAVTVHPSGSQTFLLTAPFELINTRGTVMKPKFANFKFYQKIVFKSCSLFKMHKNVRVYSQNTEKRLMWAVSLFLSAHFIKPRCNVWYCNTHVAFNVNLIAVVRLDHWYRRKTGFTQEWRCKRNKNTESFTAYKRKFRSSINPEWNEWIRVVYTFQSEVRRKIDK